MPRPAALAVLAAALGGTSIAHARPITLGVGLGLTQAKAETPGDASQTESVFGRLGLVSRLGAQLELAKFSTNDPSPPQIRSITGLAVLDLSNNRHLVPLLLAGFGFEQSDSSGGETSSAHHIEAGLGLEYRGDTGIVIGADVRLGDRTIDSMSGGPSILTDCYDCVPNASTRAGEFRSAKLYAGVRF
jgi:hypothetical protein